MVLYRANYESKYIQRRGEGNYDVDVDVDNYADKALGRGPTCRICVADIRSCNYAPGHWGSYSQSRTRCPMDGAVVVIIVH